MNRLFRRSRAATLWGVWYACTSAWLGAEPPASPCPFAESPPVVPAATSPTDADRSHALALYSQARLLQLRGESAAALWRYQRAWRYHPRAVRVLSEIVPLAARLDRHDEAARYAILAAEQAPADPALSARLAELLVREGNPRRAAGLLQAALEAARNGPADERLVQMELDFARLCQTLDEPRRANRVFLREAFTAPEKVGLTPEAIQSFAERAAEIQALLGDLFLAAEEYPHAIEAFQARHARQPDDGWLAYQLARVEAARGEFAAAEQRLTQYAASGQRAVGRDAYELLTRALAKEQAPTAATQAAGLEKLQAALDANREHDVFLEFLAEQLVAADRIDDALALLRPRVAAGTTPVVITSLVKLLTRRRAAQEAATLLGTLAGTNAADDNLAAYETALLEDPAFVAVVLTEAGSLADQQPNIFSPASLRVLARLAYSVPRPDGADRWLEAAIQAQPEQVAAICLDTAIAAMQHEQLDAAPALLERAVAGSPADRRTQASSWYLLATARELADETAAAIKAAEQARAAVPDSVRIAARLPWVLLHAKRHEAAREEYRTLLDRFGNRFDSSEDRDVVRETRLLLSQACDTLGRRDEAIDQLEVVLDEFPEDVGALNDLAYLWAESNQHLPRALDMARTAVAAEPANAAYRDTLGWVYYRLGRFPEAVAELRRACQDEDSSGVLWEHLGDACRAAGDLPEALASWRKAAAAHREEGNGAQADALETKIQRQTGN